MKRIVGVIVAVKLRRLLAVWPQGAESQGARPERERERERERACDKSWRTARGAYLYIYNFRYSSSVFWPGRLSPGH